MRKANSSLPPSKPAIVIIERQERCLGKDPAENLPGIDCPVSSIAWSWSAESLEVPGTMEQVRE
jgi:hypothetical protein